MASVRPILLTALTVAAAAAAGTPPGRLTILLEFENGYSAQSVATMEREVERIFQDNRIELVWVSRSEATAGVSGDLAIIRFEGTCLFHPELPAPRKPVPLAVTQVSDGVVLPFSAVACDRIAAFVEPAMRGIGQTRADMLFGRAMGRVVAHELAHILSRSPEHGAYGVTEPALSVDQLTCNSLPLGRNDLIGLARPDR
jgi:hypothetical protein